MINDLVGLGVILLPFLNFVIEMYGSIKNCVGA